MKNDTHDLALVLESRLRLTTIESRDERRVLETLTRLAVSRGLVLQVWSVTEGLGYLAFGDEALDTSPLSVVTAEALDDLRGWASGQ